MKERRLLLAIALGVVVGVAYGLAAGPAATNVAWLGDAFLNALKMLVIPLVFFSMVDAVSGIAATGRLGRIGNFIGCSFWRIRIFDFPGRVFSPCACPSVCGKMQRGNC